MGILILRNTERCLLLWFGGYHRVADKLPARCYSCDHPIIQSASFARDWTPCACSCHRDLDLTARHCTTMCLPKAATCALYRHSMFQTRGREGPTSEQTSIEAMSNTIKKETGFCLNDRPGGFLLGQSQDAVWSRIHDTAASLLLSDESSWGNDVCGT